MRALAVLFLGVAGCGLFGYLPAGLMSRGAMVAAPERESFKVMPWTLDGGDQGTLHPVAIERIFATENGPYERYLDWALEIEAKGIPDGYNDDGRTWVRDSKKDLAEIRKQVGNGASKSEMLRALGRVVAPGLNAAFDEPGSYTGTADVMWGAAPKDSKDRRPTQVHLIVCKFSRHADALMVTAQCFPESKLYGWDLRFVPEAFEPDADLTYEQVAPYILDLHPKEGVKL